MFDNLCEYNEREGKGFPLKELHMEDNEQSSRPSRKNLGITGEGKLVYSENWKGIAEADFMFKWTNKACFHAALLLFHFGVWLPVH